MNGLTFTDFLLYYYGISESEFNRLDKAERAQIRKEYNQLLES